MLLLSLHLCIAAADLGLLQQIGAQNGKMEPLTIITKRSIFDVAAGLDPPLHSIDSISTVTFPI